MWNVLNSVDANQTLAKLEVLIRLCVPDTARKTESRSDPLCGQ